MSDQNRDRILREFLNEVSSRIGSALTSAPFLNRLPDGLIKDRILDYSSRGGKCLRPALTCAAAGLTGGHPWKAVPAGAAIEMFHTWTLVHDDIIDRDQYRRGGPTIHHRIYRDFPDWDLQNPLLPQDHLANSMAMLIGDAQHGFVIDILAQSALADDLPSHIVLKLIAMLEGQVLPDLLTGEVSDVLQTGIPLDRIRIDEIELMLRRKTGTLLSFSVVAGGLIGLNIIDLEHPWIRILSAYGSNIGLAFQLRDDILGILGDEEMLGKPIGSDFREGKRTLAIKYAYDLSDIKTREFIQRLLGKSDMTAEEAGLLKKTVISSGAIDRVARRSEQLIHDSISILSELPDSPYLDILTGIAEYSVQRLK